MSSLLSELHCSAERSDPASSFSLISRFVADIVSQQFFNESNNLTTHTIEPLGKNCELTGFDRVIQWRRPSDFLPQGEFTDPISLFPLHPLQPIHMAKGILKNEHFHSAIAAILLKNENLVKRLFETKEYNEEGVYKLKLCDAGRWRVVTVDDYVPCQPFQKPIFTRLQPLNSEDEREQQRSIWIYLLEKAYAKVKGGYKYLEGGSTGDVMRDLTGFPLTRFDFNDQAVISMFQSGMLWKLIVDFITNKDFIVTGATRGRGRFKQDEVDAEEKVPRGLCFSVVDAKEIDNARLLKVWDQWEQVNWKGPWTKPHE